jgi:hypothetical protein
MTGKNCERAPQLPVANDSVSESPRGLGLSSRIKTVRLYK